MHCEPASGPFSPRGWVNFPNRPLGRRFERRAIWRLGEYTQVSWAKWRSSGNLGGSLLFHRSTILSEGAIMGERQGSYSWLVILGDPALSRVFKSKTEHDVRPGNVIQKALPLIFPTHPHPPIQAYTRTTILGIADSPRTIPSPSSKRPPSMPSSLGLRSKTQFGTMDYDRPSSSSHS